MTTHTQRTWGIVLVSGGLLAAVGYLLYPSTATSPWIKPAAVLVLSGVALMVPGLWAFQAVQAARSAHARALGWLGAGLLGLGILVLEVPHCVIALVDRGYLEDLDAYHASFFGQAEFYAVVALGVGEVLLTVAIWRSRTYPRWVAGLLAANIAVTVATVAVPSLSAALKVPAPNYLLCGLLGTALLVLARDRTPAVGAPDLATDAAA